MTYEDRVYGKCEINDPLALEIIASPAFKRLEGISQWGYSEPFFKGSTHTRFEHSLGVYLLLKKYDAPNLEQIAGLLHDLSHTVFSHGVDYAVSKGSEKEQTYQDDVFEEHLNKTEIPQILAKYHINSKDVSGKEGFPLQENKLPDLCADRIDYILRNARVMGEISQKQAGDFLKNLLTSDNRWVFKNFRTAHQFAKFFNHINSKFCCGTLSAIAFRAIGDYVKHALMKGYVDETDLHTTDKEIIKKINNFITTDQELKIFWDRMNNKTRVRHDPENYDVEVFCKSRAVDPLFLDGDILRRVSEADAEWRKTLEIESKPKQYFLKFS